MHYEFFLVCLSIFLILTVHVRLRWIFCSHSEISHCICKTILCYMVCQAICINSTLLMLYLHEESRICFMYVSVRAANMSNAPSMVLSTEH